MSGHEFVDDDYGYGYKTCGSRYHCPQCNEGSGMYGHYMSDKEGGFFGCQDKERSERLRASWLKR